VDTTRAQKEGTTKEYQHLEKRSGVKNGDSRIPVQLEEDGGCSSRQSRKVVTHPASSLAQDRESSPAETSVLTTHYATPPT